MGELKGSTLIKDAEFVVTMDPINKLVPGGSIGIVDNTIVEIGSDIDPSHYEQIVNAAGNIVIPGLVNTHHHMFQAFLKGHPGLQNQPIERWINLVTQAAGAMDEEMLYDAALLNMAELALYGCTTTSDMSYVRPLNKDLTTPTIKAAQALGMRFHPYAGGISLSQKDGSVFPDNVAQNGEVIAAHIEELITRYHDPDPLSMVRLGIGFCGIFTNTPQDFLYARGLSEKYGVNLQTHVSESGWENDVYAKEKFGKRPIEHLRNLGWAGLAVSHVHCINVSEAEVATLASDRTHVSHCPISNARNSEGEKGIAPIASMLKAGVNVALGVDGSAGNDSSALREELRWARTISGIPAETTYLDPATVLQMGTIHGAKLLGREAETGSLEPGKAADIALFNLDTVEMAGSWDPVTALLSTQGTRANAVMINGKWVVRESRLVETPSTNEEALVQRVAQHMQKLRSLID